MNYTHQFGLKGFPFEPSIDSHRMFESEAVQEATGRLRQLVERRGIGLITGEAGSGKTTVCRQVASQLNARSFKVLYVSHSTGSVLDTFNAIAAELGLPPAYRQAEACQALRHQISQLVVEKRQSPLLIFDEAHLLRNEVLENLRLLSNFSMDSEPRLSMVLVGLTVLDRRLALAVHEPFAQRLILHHRLGTLQPTEIQDYIAHRLVVAGAPEGLQIFEPAALEAIRLAVKGLPRLVNNLAHYALTAAALDQAQQVTSRHVELAVAEFFL